MPIGGVGARGEAASARLAEATLAEGRKGKEAREKGAASAPVEW